MLTKGLSIDRHILTGINGLEVEDNTVRIPDYVTCIDADLEISNGELITKIVFGGGITSIQRLSFNHLTNLKDIIFMGKLDYIGDCAFMNCSNLDHVLLPDTTRVISKKAFYHTGLFDITIPSSVESIEDMAFSNCDKLTSIKYSAKTESIANGLFSLCTKLKSITFNTRTLRRIESGFFNCVELESVELPDSIEEFSIYSFTACEKLKTIYYKGIEVPFTNDSIGGRIVLNCDFDKFLAIYKGDQIPTVYDTVDFVMIPVRLAILNRNNEIHSKYINENIEWLISMAIKNNKHEEYVYLVDLKNRSGKYNGTTNLFL